MADYILYHHGVKGMRWGIRKDRTSAGGSKGSKKSGLSRFFTKKKSTKAVEDETQEMTIEKKKEKILKSRSAKELYNNADLFTTQELQTAYNRLVLERNIQQLAPKEVSRGKQFIDNSVKTGNTMHSLFDTGSKLYNDTAKVYNTFFRGDGDPLPIIKDNDGKKDGKKKDK